MAILGNHSQQCYRNYEVPGVEDKLPQAKQVFQLFSEPSPQSNRLHLERCVYQSGESTVGKVLALSPGITFAPHMVSIEHPVVFSEHRTDLLRAISWVWLRTKTMCSQAPSVFGFCFLFPWCHMLNMAFSPFSSRNMPKARICLIRLCTTWIWWKQITLVSSSLTPPRWRYVFLPFSSGQLGFSCWLPYFLYHKMHPTSEMKGVFYRANASWNWSMNI